MGSKDATRLIRNEQERSDPAVSPLLITTSWDDGHPSDLRVADLLEKHGLCGTFYVPTRNSEGRPVMCASEVRELGRRFEIGGHTTDHVSLTEIAPVIAAAQISGNKLWLEDLLGREVTGFAYVRGHYNRVVRDLVDKAGFRYARTVRNFASTSGRDRLQVPTTVQFYAHSPSTYLRNYLSGGPSLRRAAVLAAVLTGGDLSRRVVKAAEACARSGGFFHLWGHSWEIEEHNLWGELDRLFAQLATLRASCATNAVWCAGLIGSTGRQSSQLHCRESEGLA